MSEMVAGQQNEIHQLLLEPSAENVLRAANSLESLAQDVAGLRLSLDVGEDGRRAATQAFLLAARAEALRCRDLLDNAARFYNGLNATVETAGYECHGLFRVVESPRRALARL